MTSKFLVNTDILTKFMQKEEIPTASTISVDADKIVVTWDPQFPTGGEPFFAADNLWQAGKGKLWDYDNNADTTEEHVLITHRPNAGQYGAVLTILRTV